MLNLFDVTILFEWFVKNRDNNLLSITEFLNFSVRITTLVSFARNTGFSVVVFIREMIL